MLRNPLDRFLAQLEWRWSLANLIYGAVAVASAIVPAWAVMVTSYFAEYQPISWVLAAFIGFFAFSASYFVIAFSHEKIVRARYNSLLLSKRSDVDPLASVFERKRIFLSEFVLPSNPWISEKTFIDCEIVGPANMFLIFGNRIDEPGIPICDGVVVAPQKQVFNCYNVTNCTFRRCRFLRVTILLSDQEYRSSPGARELNWLNWMSHLPDSDFPLFDNRDRTLDEKDGPAAIEK